MGVVRAVGPFASAAGIGTTRLPASDLGVPASDLDDSPVNGLVDEAARLLEGDSRSLSWLGPPLNSLVPADPRAACDRRPFAVRGECWISGLVPGWKFDGDEPPPCMGEVIATIPDGTPAFTVERLMTPPCDGS